MVVRGVPARLAKDGWWLDDETPRPKWMLGGLLGLCVVLADQMLWSRVPGLGFVVWVLAIGIAVHVTLWADITKERGLRAWALLLVALVPAVDLVQFTSAMIALAGLLGFAAYMVLGRWDAPVIVRAMLRLPMAGAVRVAVDALALRISVPSGSTLRAVVFDWGLPLGIGAVFIGLMIFANPLLDRWLLELTRFERGMSWDDFVRMLFWVLIACAVWPFLRLTDMAETLCKTPVARAPMRSTGLLNARSVIRALVVFNLIFAVQSLLDIGYLWGGVTLPEGMTYATYAHRGAYPLMLTALLAGLFALMSGPLLQERSLVRGLMYLWVGQTVLLVLSSILRLDLYVDAYGLTRLRFAAIIWMVVVALGLVLMIMQLVGRQSIGWFVIRAAGLGLLAVYVSSLVNVDGLIARNGLARAKPDYHYICNLGPGAAVAIRQSGACIHGGLGWGPEDDWREWGYRHARLRHSLAQMEVVQ